jgi:membrane peptidoglycan carboxypeptidase
MKGKKIRRGGRLRRIFRIFALSLLLLSVGIVGGTVTWLCVAVDIGEDVRLFEAAQGSRTTRIYYNANREGSVYLPVEWESERIFGGESAIWCAYEDIPDLVKNAFLAVEDHRYYEHNGVDWPRFTGALIVCEGAGNASVRLALTQAVASLTGLTADRITVVKGKP